MLSAKGEALKKPGGASCIAQRLFYTTTTKPQLEKFAAGGAERSRIT